MSDSNVKKTDDSSLRPGTGGISAKDVIYRQAAIDAPFKKWDEKTGVTWIPLEHIERLPSAEPETCEGCKHLGKWENEVEYGYPSPCTCCKRRADDHFCKRRAEDHYER